MISDDRDQAGAPENNLEQRAKQDSSEAARRVQEDARAAADRAAEDAKALGHEAEAQVEQAAERARSFASDQKDYAASQITGIASAISRVADELEEEQATTARYARDLAKNLDRFGRRVEGKSLDDLMGEAQQFGRSQPLAFLGAAALAGFMASRFAGASSHRRDQRANDAPSTGRSASGAAYGRPNAGGADAAGRSAYGRSNGNQAGGGNVPG